MEQILFKQQKAVIVFVVLQNIIEGLNTTIYIMRMNQKMEDKKDINIKQQYDNIIKQTRQKAINMSVQERFQAAKLHILDALHNRQPRNICYSQPLPYLYSLLYYLQSSSIWSWLMFLTAYTFMYLIILDNQNYVLKIILESTILLIFIIDNAIDFYCRSFDTLKKTNRYPKFYFWKALLILLMIIDLIVFISLPCHNQRPIRPFRILRSLIPVIYDAQLRKSLRSLISAYKVIIVFLIFYAIVIFGFAYIGSVTIHYDNNFVDKDFPNFPKGFDTYHSNFKHFGYMIFQIYTLATYDDFPDFQTSAIQYYKPNYIFFAVFIFLNMFFFASVPGTLIYNKIRQARSTYILIDEIRQQHSLILAFVILAQDQNNLPMQILIKFLFEFYRKKIRYIEYITEIVLKLDDNNNQTIQVNQFMQLSKLILYNSIMYPPSFDDLQPWISFRNKINELFYIENIVNHWIFKIINYTFILLGCINGCYLLFSANQLVKIFDSIFVWLFFGELVVKIIGIGPQVYTSDRLNNIDAFLILLNIVFFFVKFNNNIDNLFIINRILRIVVVVRAIFSLPFIYNCNIQIVIKFQRLFSTFMEIFPIIIRFFLLFAFIFFIYGVLGMELFYDLEKKVQKSSKYGEFVQFSNFKTFIYSQYLLMQVLTQGGWATVCFQYCSRAPNFYAAIAILFVSMHFLIVTVIGTLLKGIFWQIYFTVENMLDQIDQKIKNKNQLQEQKEQKLKQIKKISQMVNLQEQLQPNTLISRQIIQKKLDYEIFNKIGSFDYQGNQPIKLNGENSYSNLSQRSINRSKILNQILSNNNMTPRDLKMNTNRKIKKSKATPKLRRMTSFDFLSIQEKQEEQQIEQLLNRLILSDKIPYAYIIVYPKVFVNFLKSKFKTSDHYMSQNGFDLNINPLRNEQSMKFHIYEMNLLLNTQNSLRQKKQLIVQILAKNNLINQNLKEKIIKTNTLVKQFHIDTAGAQRMMYLSETNEDLVRKLEVQYFSDIYGNSFKQINKVTLQPLLKVSASLTYVLWNILSYSNIKYQDFFHFITHIEDQMSHNLLKKGSLVKFVYKMSHQSDIWFMVEHKKNQQIQIRFIKTGLWAYLSQMKQGQVYYARDVFNHNNQQDGFTSQGENAELQQYLKLFYESFQTLGFSLYDKESFFQSNPKQFIYDLYVQNFQVNSLQRPERNTLNNTNTNNNLKISNIMLAILSKQQERMDIGQKNLSYKVSDIQSRKRKFKKDDFILQDEDKQTFEKLKNLAAMDNQKIIESQGLPFAYVINLMKQISQMINFHKGNFVNHVQKSLNTQYNSFQNSSINDEYCISLEQVKVTVPNQYYEQQFI